MSYNELVTDYFFHPSHVGELESDTQFSAVVRKSEQISTYMQLSLQCDASGKITRALFKSRGDPYTIAGLEWICRALIGKNINSTAPITYTQIMTVLEMPNKHYPRAIALEQITTEVISLIKKRNPI